MHLKYVNDAYRGMFRIVNEMYSTIILKQQN